MPPRYADRSMYPEPKLLPAGDLAVSVEFGNEISPAINTRVRALEHVIRARAVPGIVETVPTFRALLIYYDPLVLDWDALEHTVRTLIADTATGVAPPARFVEIPCCYEPDVGLDLVAAGAKLGLTPVDVVRLHTGDDYLVYFLGFTPGLPYMVGQSERLTIPRLEKPRTKVPAGSVGIGGRQCCIYPVESPGGFWILGRTPLPLYDPSHLDPALLRPGDRVRFRAVTRDEFARIAAEGDARRFVREQPGAPS